MNNTQTTKDNIKLHITQLTALFGELKTKLENFIDEINVILNSNKIQIIYHQTASFVNISSILVDISSRVDSGLLIDETFIQDIRQIIQKLQNGVVNSYSVHNSIQTNSNIVKLNSDINKLISNISSILVNIEKEITTFNSLLNNLNQNEQLLIQEQSDQISNEPTTEQTVKVVCNKKECCVKNESINGGTSVSTKLYRINSGSKKSANKKHNRFTHVRRVLRNSEELSKSTFKQTKSNKKTRKYLKRKKIKHTSKKNRVNKK